MRATGSGKQAWIVARTLAGALLICSACDRVEGPVGVAPFRGSAELTGDWEEEIFGCFEVGDSSGTWEIILAPRSGSSLPDSADSTMTANFLPALSDSSHENKGADWGWFEAAAQAPCYGGVAADSGMHRLQSNGQRQEGDDEVMEYHCVSIGNNFTLDVLHNSTTVLRREIDYPKWVKSVSPWVPASSGTDWTDVVVNYDDVNAADGSVTADIEVNLVQDLATNGWTAVDTASDGKYHVPAGWYTRLGAWTSTAPSGHDLDEALVRYFWNYPSSPSERSGFTNVTSAGASVMRVTQYTTAAVNRTILAQIVMPYEYPSTRTDMTDTAYGAKVALAFHIDTALTAVISADDTAWVGAAVSYSDVGANGGGVLSRFWAFGDGDTVTAASPSHTFNSAGTYVDTLYKTHQYHSLVATDTHTILVAEPLAADSIHGFYPDPSDHTVQPHEQCSWEAHHHGGLGSTSYQWQWRTRGWWQNLDTSKIQEIQDVGEDDFQLRFVVTRGTQADTVTALSVTVDASGQYCTAK